MHQQRSKSTLRDLRFRAILFLTNLSALVTAVALLATSLFLDRDDLLKVGFAFFILYLLSFLLFTVLSFNWKCPLCVGAVWKNTTCRRNKNAVKFLGISYRLGVAVSALTGQPYRCPYCGEKFSTTKTRR